LALVLLTALVVAMASRGWGFTARAEPSELEARLALAARAWLIPATTQAMANPLPATPETLDAGLKHWADHCATCHANNGSGDTAIGRSLYPPAPDMRGERTQGMTDGELFYIIERGVPFTGMPAWSTGTVDGERASWELVRFVRQLPSLSSEDLVRMESLNPRSAIQIENERRLQEFLKGGK